MTFVQLERQFIPWADPEKVDAEARLAIAGSGEKLEWLALLEKRRVVVLAEAGSGKSKELAAQAAIKRAAGDHAFYATVQDVAREGIPGALWGRDRTEFEAWALSSDPAWFFVDSVDEAKLDGIRLETALRRLADGLGSASARAHLVLSGRYTDWEFRADLERFDAALPLSREKPPPVPEAPHAALIEALHSDRRREVKSEEKVEGAVVVLMTPLDASRIRIFAERTGVLHLNEFMRAIDAGNLWSLAARPLDLMWLVEFWKRERRFGPFAEMLETSLTERLKETNLQHARTDPIATSSSILALERIGAALDFSRTDKLSIPDSSLASRSASDGFNLSDVLPDWTPDHRQRLLTRPVFDPATFGRVRLHNDNNGVVRSYLAAKWLSHRRQNDCSRDQLFELLFADIYGFRLVRPSMSQTAAWLSLWDTEVAREVIEREPLLLLSAGDPASLPLLTRSLALTKVAALIAGTGERFSRPDRDSFRRFSSSDMAPVVEALWAKHKSQNVRLMLLQMIGFGALSSCRGIAVEAAFAAHPDRYTAIYAGRALLAVADEALMSRYANWIKTSSATLPGQALWDAIDGLFPEHISVEELLSILGSVDAKTRDENYGVQLHGPGWVEKLTSQRDVEHLLSGLLPLVGEPRPITDYEESDAEKAYGPAIAAASHLLLTLAGPDEVPLVAIDAALRLGADRFHQQRAATTMLQDDLHLTPNRRRLAFWRAAAEFRGHPLIRDGFIANTAQMSMLGWAPGLRAEDFAWLLQDACALERDDERHLAIDAALEIWRDTGKSDTMLDRIREAANSSATLAAHVRAWTTPRAPTELELAFQSQTIEQNAKREAELAARDASWVEFIDKLKVDPDQLRKLPPPTRESIDARLFSLWELLCGIATTDGRYAIDDVTALEPILGKELSAATRDALITFSHLWNPVLASDRPAAERNLMNRVDSMGLTGVSLDAKGRPNWASSLNAADATRCARYAMLEFIGFPSWFTALAKSWPTEARDVLLKEAVSQMSTPASGPTHGVLDNLVNGPVELCEIVAVPLLREMREGRDVEPHVLVLALDVICRGLTRDEDKAAFATFALERFERPSDDDAAAKYLGAAFKFNPVEAASSLSSKLDGLDQNGQTRLSKGVLPKLFGSSRFGRDEESIPLPADVLERVVMIAFRTIRVEDDYNRPSGTPYSPDDRDAAENARGHALNNLASLPGSATIEALKRLSKVSDFPMRGEYLDQLISNRAKQDSEHAPWGPSEAYELERLFDVAPRRAADLQEVACRRLRDIQHDLHYDDFAQGQTVQALAPETEVQKWVASQLRSRQGRAYSVEREPHVADEKEPDIRLRARSSDASVPIEIKVAESWSLPELVVALRDQLGGRYLKARDAKHGILLLVHQKSRPRGWCDEHGNWLNFGEVVCLLQRLAEEAAGESHDAPQSIIALIDVSDVVPP